MVQPDECGQGQVDLQDQVYQWRFSLLDDKDFLYAASFPPEIIQHAVWLYFRFMLSFRDVEHLLAERRLDISYDNADSG